MFLKFYVYASSATFFLGKIRALLYLLAGIPACRVCKMRMWHAKPSRSIHNCLSQVHFPNFPQGCTKPVLSLASTLPDSRSYRPRPQGSSTAEAMDKYKMLAEAAELVPVFPPLFGRLFCFSNTAHAIYCCCIGVQQVGCFDDLNWTQPTI